MGKPKGGKELRMKKNIFKKIVASLATAAMAVGMFAAMPAENVKAADELYVIGGFCSWSWDDCATLTSSDGDTYKGEVTVSGDSELVINTVKNWDGGDAAKMTYKYGDYTGIQTTVAFENAGTYELTYNKTSQELKTTAKSTIEVNWTYTYYVAGDASLGAADWAAFDASTATKMTESNGTCTLTTTATKDGEFGYKIIKIGTPDVSTVDSTTTWIGDPDNGDNDYKVTVAANGEVKFTFDIASGKATATTSSSSATQPSSSSEDSSKKDDSTETTTAASGSETTTAATESGITVEVTLDSSIKWDEVYVYTFGYEGANDQWPGQKMTEKDGKYYATLDINADKVSYVFSNGNGEQTIDVVDVTGTNAKISISATQQDGKYVAEVTKATATADVAPVIVMLAVAAVAGALVVSSRKKTVNE